MRSKACEGAARPADRRRRHGRGCRTPPGQCGGCGRASPAGWCCCRRSSAAPSVRRHRPASTATSSSPCASRSLAPRLRAEGRQSIRPLDRARRRGPAGHASADARPERCCWRRTTTSTRSWRRGCWSARAQASHGRMTAWRRSTASAPPAKDAAPRFDLMLMDVRMPGPGRARGGAANQGDRRPSWTCRRTRIVALTANAFEEDRRLALAAGMDDTVSKPVDEAA